MVRLFIIYLPFFKHGSFGELLHEMKNTSHGVVHLPLLTPSPSFYPVPARGLTLCTISMSFLARWLLAGLAQWEAPAMDLESGPSFLPVAPSLSCPCGLAVPLLLAQHLSLSSSLLQMLCFRCLLILYHVTASQHAKPSDSASSMVACPESSP